MSPSLTLTLAVCAHLYLWQVRAGGQGQAGGEGSAGVVRHHRVSDGDGNALHALQGRLQPEEQPAEPGHHQVQQPVHGDRGVHQQG